MSETTSYSEIKQGSERGFGLVFCVVFLIITGFVYYKSGTINYWLLSVAIAFGLIALTVPKVLKPLNFVWFKFGMLLGHIIAPLVMMIIFFLVVTPIGLLMRVFGKDSLRLKRTLVNNSYWIKREDNPEAPPSMKNQF